MGDPTASSTHCLHPGDHLRQGKGFHHVVITSRSQGGHPIVHPIPGREEQDQRIHTAGAQFPAYADPIQARHHDVEHNHIRLPGSGTGERLSARTGPGHVKAGIAQRRCNGIDDGRLIVHHEHPRREVHAGIVAPAVWSGCGREHHLPGTQRGLWELSAGSQRAALASDASAMRVVRVEHARAQEDSRWCNHKPDESPPCVASVSR